MLSYESGFLHMFASVLSLIWVAWFSLAFKLSGKICFSIFRPEISKKNSKQHNHILWAEVTFFA